jgi:nicotinate-nucleotide adenylyltransferase
VLTPYPPHKKKQKITSIVNRERMVELAIDDNPLFVMSSIDIDRPPPHYAIDTMLLLREQRPYDDFYYLMGLDSLNDLLTWHRPVDFINLCNGIIIMGRQGDTVQNDKLFMEIPGLHNKMHFLKAPIIEISGTDIRSRVRNSIQYRYFVPEKVYQYILGNQLYKS